MKFKTIIISVLFSISFNIYSQDTINKKRLTIFISSNIIAYSGGMIMLNQLWYKDYPHTDFHWFNDNDEWLQMDKFGHAYTSYYLSKVLSKGFSWSGVNNRKSAILGASLGFFYISSLEIYDGFSENWGASYGDLIANFSGSSIYLAQELIWQEQKIIPKFSFHTTDFPSYRPELLGSTLSEQILKDYNGQTYWLSVNVKSIAHIDKFPTWLNFAFGYGATGMTGGITNPENTIDNSERMRQYYFSLDVDLNRIKTKSRVLKTVFSFVNMVKIPFPTLEFSKDGVKAYPIYF